MSRRGPGGGGGKGRGPRGPGARSDGPKPPGTRGGEPRRRDERRAPGKAKDHRRRGSGAARETDALIVGRHPVADALTYNPSRAKRLLLAGGRGDDELEAAAKKAGVSVQRVSADELDDKSRGVPHQGAVLECAPFVFGELEDGLEADSLILALDGVEDPRNLGAATRAALALGADRVIIPARRAAQPTASAHKAAAGALSRLPVVQVENLRRALDQAKEAGWWIVGAEADGKAAPWQVDWTDKMVLVVGGEDRGLRRLVREACDHVVSVPMAADGVTLNAADAATVLLYEALRQRKQAAAAEPAD